MVLSRFLLSPEKGVIIDHISGNALDNTRQNLRITDSYGNNANAFKRRNAKTSKFKGVSYSSREGKWKAQIQVSKKKIHIGTFSSEEEAANAYNVAAQLYFEDYAKTNTLKDAK